jgi:hypothetical protein
MSDFPKPDEIHFGVNPSRLKVTLAEVIADFLQRQPLVDQTSCTGMP